MARAPFHRAVPGLTRRPGHCSFERCPGDPPSRALPFRRRTVNIGGPLVSLERLPILAVNVRAAQPLADPQLGAGGSGMGICQATCLCMWR